MAAIAAPPLSEAADAEARLVKAVVLGSVRALRRAALRDLEALAALEPDRASVWLGVAEHAEAFDRQLAARAQEALRRLVPDASCGALVRSMRARGAEAVAAAARRCMQEGVSDSDELVGMGQALTESGQYDEARALYAAATELAPNVREVWTGLSLAAFATGRPEDVRAAEVALERARALEPGDARLGAEIKLRAAKRAGDDDEKLLVEPPALLAARAARPARPGEEADRQLYWLRRVRFLDDRRVAQTIHYAREVVIAPRTQRELQENLPAEGDTTEILRARVHRAAGGVAFAEEQDSDPHRPRVRWPQLERGDVVEVALRTFTAGPVGGRGDPPFYFFDYAGAPETHPLLYNEVVVDSPVASPLAIDVLNGKPDRREERVLAGRRVVRLLWDRPASVADEPLAPHLSEVVPVVVGSTFSSWKDFLDWYRAAVRGFTEPDEQVRRMAAEITKGAGGREEKLRRIFDYVADNVRYVNYTSGEWWLPNRPQQVLARRQGDCDDKAILLITLLKAVGIEATEVLVQTRFTAQPSVLRSKAAAIPLFDHGIAYLPGRAGAPARWLDATSPQSRLGPVPAMDARTLALFVDQGAPEVVATPPSAPSEHGVASRWTVRLDDAGGGEIEVEERHAGDHGFVLRNNLLEPDARSQWVEQNLLAGWFSGTKLDGKVRFEPDLGNGTARVGFSARSGAVARREASDLVVELAPATTMASQLAPLARRTLPVVLPPQYAPSHGTRVIRIVAPRGWTLGPLPPGGEERGGEFGTARLSLARDPARADAVVVTRQVDFDANVIAVDKYPAWRAWLQRVDALLHRGVRFVPPLAR
jgi:transglutaminase-like putative cysteine protease